MDERRHKYDNTLPSPSANFTLPSLYDDLELDCRLYFPRRWTKEGLLLARGCAVFAHPYAPLGGCYDDPVVNSVGSILLKQGYLLVTFNFRGADQSPGKTSWSGRGELGDYIAVYAFCLSMLTLPETLGHFSHEQSEGPDIGPVLLLGGYSYGSMIAAHLPGIHVIRDCLQNAADGSPEKEIENRAHELGHAFLGFCETQSQRRRKSRQAPDPAIPTSGAVTVGGYESLNAARRISRERSRRKVEVERVRHSVERVRRKLSSHRIDSPITDQRASDEKLVSAASKKMVLPKLRYLLVSPLLGPIASLATMFSRLKFERRGLQRGQELPLTRPEDVLSTNASLIVYGTADHFTSSTKVKAWCAKISAAPGSLSTSTEIHGAGHFWHEPAFQAKLNETIQEWLASFDRLLGGHG